MVFPKTILETKPYKKGGKAPGSDFLVSICHLMKFVENEVF